MDQLFKKLSYSQQEDSSWVSKLNVSIPKPPQLDIGTTENPNEITKKNDNSAIDINSTDIIPLLIKPNELTQLIMEPKVRRWGLRKGYIGHMMVCC